MYTGCLRPRNRSDEAGKCQSNGAIYSIRFSVRENQRETKKPFFKSGTFGSEKQLFQKRKPRYSFEYRVVSMAGDEGFEPPQTESESGVLPLHKSPICRALSKRIYYYTQKTLFVKKNFLTFFCLFHSLYFRRFFYIMTLIETKTRR